jgi:hypothetical protein
MVWILCDHHGSRGSGKEVEVVDVVTGASHHRVISVPHQDCVTVVYFEYGTPSMIGAVEILERKRVRIFHAVVVDLVEVCFDWRIVDFVLVWRVAGPIASGRVDLHHH